MRVRIRIRDGLVSGLAAMLIITTLSAEELTLQQAVSIAVNNNPTLAAGRLSVDAARHSAKGARALSNPDLIVAPSVIGDAGSDSAVLFSQPLEINGTRSVRGQIASNQAAAMGFDAEATQRDVVLRVTQGYWDVAQAQNVVRLNQDNVAYIETVRAAVQRQYDVGAVPGAQLLKMDVELSRARQELAQSELVLRQSKSSLNSLMARPTITDFAVTESLDFSNTAPSRDAMLASALTRRPEVAAAQAQVAAAQGEIKAARLKRVPDVALQARKESFDPDDNSGGVAIAISLPVLDWGSAKEERRRAESAAQSKQKQLEAVRNSVSLDVDQAIHRLDTASRVVREYEGGVVAKSEELAAMARKGYEKGANNYLELLEAQRTLRSVRSDYYSSLAEHAKAVAQLEWAAACTIERPAKSEVEK